MTNPVGKGFGTSEFALTLAGVLASLLVTFGIIDGTQAKNISNLIAEVITGAIALISIWGVISQYVHGRNQIKQQMITQGLNVAQPVAPAQPTP